MTTQDQAAAVLQHHMDCALAGDSQGVLSDYTEDSIIIMPTGTFRGVEGYQEAMGQLSHLFTEENRSKMNMVRKEVQGDVAYLAWTMGDVIPFGTDTFVVRNGKIATQTIGLYIP